MTDRELLELAAKAAAIGDLAVWSHYSRREWNPLTDDGDALRLAVQMKFRIDVDTAACVVTYAWNVLATEPVGANPYAATRRAIVRAAAEIGRTM